MSAHAPMPKSAWIFPALAMLLFAGVTATGYGFAPSAGGVLFAIVLLVILFAPEGIYWRLRAFRPSRAVDTPTESAPAAIMAGASGRAPLAPGAALLDVRGVSKAFQECWEVGRSNINDLAMRTDALRLGKR